MRITNLTVDGFGVWHGLELRDLSEQLNVVYGPNEAGKTTLMQFVRSMFFGFSPERRARYLPPLDGGRPGGTVFVRAEDADCAVIRHADEHGESDELVVAHGTRHAVDSHHALAGLLGDVDEATFGNVFVCGLREIQELATLSDTQAAAELYNLAVGLDRVSLVDVMQELHASRERLLAGDDRPSLVTQLLSQRGRLRAEIDELAGEAPRYLELLAERQGIDNQIATLEADSAAREEQLRGMALARALADRWHQRRALDDQLAGLVGIDSLPDNALVRFEQLEHAIAALARRMRRLKRQRRELRGQIAELNVNEALRRTALRFEALSEQQHWIASLEKQVAELQSEVAGLERHAEASKEQFGVAAPAAATLSKRTLSELRDAARELQAARHEAGQSKQHTSASEQTLAGHRQRIDDALGAARDQGITVAMAEAGELVSQLRRRVQIDERINQLTARETELEHQSHDHLDEQMLPTWALAGLGGLFVLGCALVLLYLAGFVLPATLGDSLSWPVGLVGVAAAAAAGMMKFSMERAAAGRLDRCQDQISLLGDQLAAARAERDELDAALPRGGGPLVARLQAAEQALARLEELLPLQAELDSADRQAETLRQHSGALDERVSAARRHWKQLLADAGLPADLTPRQLKAFVHGRREVAGLDATLAERRAELGRRRTEYDALAARITQLVAQAGVTPRSQQPLEQLQQCLSELAEQQTQLKTRDEVGGQIARLKRRYRKSLARRNQLRRRKLSLMRAAGTLDEIEFRRRAALQADASRIRSEHAQLDHEISTALAAGSDATQIEAWLAAGENLAVLETEVVEQNRTANERLSQSRERRGELNHQLQLMADDRRLGDKRMELDVVERRLSEALERWRVLAVCGLLLEEVREYYEREHQPQALKEASGYLEQLTGGRYPRVWTPLGQHALRVDDATGRSLTVDVLSSGTREQLFLALRLALAGSYARRGVELPLVLDDVLVNFDAARSKSAAHVLRDFAKRGHQILVFTCHEHIAKLFKNVKAEVRHLPDRADPAALVVEKPAPAKTRPPRPAAPPPEPVPAPIADPAPADTALEAEPVDVAPPSPPPTPKPVPPPPAPPKPRRRAKPRTEQVEWDAEEFAGELADRVRSDLVDGQPNPQGPADTGDTQAA